MSKGFAAERASDGDWAERIAALDAPARAPRRTLSTDRIVDAACALVDRDGYEALTMRRLAAALGTGPASLYAHVRGKADLDDLLLGRVCREVVTPTPDPARWRDQFVEVCASLRDAYARHPGVAAAAFAAAPRSPDALRVAESLLALLLAGGVDPRRAAWTIDAAFLYVTGFSLEQSMRERAEGPRDPEEVARRLRMLPAARFPSTVAHAAELTSGSDSDRFSFTLRALLDGVAGSSPQGARGAVAQ